MRRHSTRGSQPVSRRSFSDEPTTFGTSTARVGDRVVDSSVAAQMAGLRDSLS